MGLVCDNCGSTDYQDLWCGVCRGYVIGNLRQELEQLKQRTKSEEMICGHERRFLISADEGTNYCAACSYEAQLAEARAENERLLNVVRSMEAKADGHYEDRHKAGPDDWLWVRAMCRDVMKEGLDETP